jgi:hypothetical protein
MLTHPLPYPTLPYSPCPVIMFTILHALISNSSFASLILVLSPVCSEEKRSVAVKRDEIFQC